MASWGRTLPTVVDTIFLALEPALRGKLPAAHMGVLGGPVVFIGKDPRTGQYFQLQEQEYFLLLLLDPGQTTGAIRTAFEERFGEPLGEEDLDDFLKLLAEQGLLVAASERPEPAGGAEPRTSDPASPLHRQSILHWRQNFFDPDRLFTWLAPRRSWRSSPGLARPCPPAGGMDRFFNGCCGLPG